MLCNSPVSIGRLLDAWLAAQAFSQVWLLHSQNVLDIKKEVFIHHGVIKNHDILISEFRTPKLFI